MRITRLAFWSAIAVAVAAAFQSFPAAPSERAAVVCRPVLFFGNVVAELSASMNDSGRIGPQRQPWHGDVHRACLRIAERVFLAGAES